uniref:Uncharacterized protein n=1 Tax=Quercus lobata TaxID=97700 RepID=A0A7N2M5P6_QUELO
MAYKTQPEICQAYSISFVPYSVYFQVPKTGLNTPFQGGLLKDVAESVIKWAKDGLERRGIGELMYLNELAEDVTTGVTPAEKLVQMYNEKFQVAFSSSSMQRRRPVQHPCAYQNLEGPWDLLIRIASIRKRNPEELP